MAVWAGVASVSPVRQRGERHRGHEGRRGRQQQHRLAAADVEQQRPRPERQYPGQPGEREPLRAPAGLRLGAGQGSVAFNALSFEK
jgi:hypothetical protein